jgi:hypothetical protein
VALHGDKQVEENSQNSGENQQIRRSQTLEKINSIK